MNNRLGLQVHKFRVNKKIVKEVRSGEETSRNPRAYTERSPRRYVGT